MGIRIRLFLLLVFASFAGQSWAQAQIRGVPKLPTSGNSGLQGSLGAGFGDFTVDSPKDDFQIDRGTYLVASIERGFDFLHLYLTLGLSYMNATGAANYKYSNLSTSTTYSATDVRFSSSISDLSLGLKLKLIDGYWFRPYIEGGGLAGYHQITYTSKQDVLSAIGPDYKSKDVAMGTGTYAEAGLEAMFSEKFGVKLAGRLSKYRTKSLPTLFDRELRFTAETYYFSLLFGF